MPRLSIPYLDTTNDADVPFYYYILFKHCLLHIIDLCEMKKKREIVYDPYITEKMLNSINDYQDLIKKTFKDKNNIHHIRADWHSKTEEMVSAKANKSDWTFNLYYIFIIETRQMIDRYTIKVDYQQIDNILYHVGALNQLIFASNDITDKCSENTPYEPFGVYLDTMEGNKMLNMLYDISDYLIRSNKLKK